MPVDQELAGLRRRVSSLTTRLEMAQGEVTRLEGVVAQLAESSMTQEQVLKVLQGFAERLQGMVQEDVSRFVSEGIKAVFGEDKIFRLEFGLRANQVVATMTLDDIPLNEQGGVHGQSGGVLNVISWLLRLWVVLRLSSFCGISRVILLDEPFGRLRGMDYQTRICELLPKLSKELGVQTLWIADDNMPVEGSDLIYLFTKKAGKVTASVQNCCDS